MKTAEELFNSVTRWDMADVGKVIPLAHFRQALKEHDAEIVQLINDKIKVLKLAKKQLIAPAFAEGVIEGEIKALTELENRLKEKDDGNKQQ